MSSINPAKVRTWPAFVVLAMQGAAILYSVSAEFDNLSRFIAMMAGPAVSLLLFLVYWFGFSRIPWRDRLRLPLVSLVAAVVVGVLAHSTARPAMWIYGIPLTLFLMTTWTLLNRFESPHGHPRRGAVLLALGWLPFLLVRLEGFSGSYLPELVWRWTPTTEERLAFTRPARDASASDTATPPPALQSSPQDWPGFRGLNRDSRVVGARINADWTAKPPKQLWKIAVGPGWSSFAIVGDSLFTQEQFGAEEAVVCYNAMTGLERWRHVDAARFSELVAGPGPRATPTFADGRIYTLGAEANFNCLDAATGRVIWRRDLMQEIGAKLPEWGFAASPLVMAGLAIVNADGTEGRGLVAYNAVTGEPAWHVPSPGMNFSSAQRMVFGEKEFAVFASGTEVFAVDPQSGEILWRSSPTGWKAASMIQPQQIDASSLVVGLGDGIGTARLQVIPSAGNAWSTTQLWSSKNLKPSFNDFVFYQGALYGFDQSIFACVDAQTGKRLWKKGRYGFGQALLFEDQGLILVVAETGELVLLACDPKVHRELARYPAITGKTWNHPAFSRGRLYVRNGEEAVCLDLSP